MKELTNRILIAVVGIPLGVFIIWYGNWFYFFAIVAIANLALFEMHKIAKSKQLKPLLLLNLLMLNIFLAFTFILTAFSPFFFLDPKIMWIAKWLFSYFIFYFVVSLMLNLFLNKDNHFVNFTSTIGILFYVLLPFASLMIIRLYDFGWLNQENSWKFLLSYFFSIWVCDSIAYFIGKKWGSHKLAPQISPQKSWEGAIAGFIGAVTSFAFFSKIFNLDLSFTEAILLGAIVGAFGQIGDFAESSFKRDAKIKDTSNLLGQHGGILDRFDSIIFTSPIVLFYLIFV